MADFLQPAPHLANLGIKGIIGYEEYELILFMDMLLVAELNLAGYMRFH